MKILKTISDIVCDMIEEVDLAIAEWLLGYIAFMFSLIGIYDSKFFEELGEELNKNSHDY